MIHLITTCAKSKNKDGIKPVVLQTDASLQAVQQRWNSSLQERLSSSSGMPVISLYRGAHWSTAIDILRHTPDLQLWVISAGLGFLHYDDRAIPYEATFNTLPFSSSAWWLALNAMTGITRRCRDISTLMHRYPDDCFLIAGSPVYLAAIEDDVCHGVSALHNVASQLTVITSQAYSGILTPFVTYSHAGMLGELGANMVTLNIRLARQVIQTLTHV
ncbi:hypothetical protein FP371_23170 [Citrobacter freundii]|nr:MULTISPECIES: hypothetical protein [Gammaproteobacteria]EEA2350384.1 hypothetical protein [Salmonella enterica subsp. enterica serovar Enteritidis]EEC4304162.1 hypothetical protein [Salmonella enterica subsp. enterica serovar Enteritidis]EEN2406586.1 hypothetical protein [Salmonella enterica subsp. enterica serovar Enteritidis]EES8921632.1 hypothetical protein [Escherichia coli]EES9863453.1 hypothetical protein [Escherichia coli]